VVADGEFAEQAFRAGGCRRVRDRPLLGASAIRVTALCVACGGLPNWRKRPVIAEPPPAARMLSRTFMAISLCELAARRQDGKSSALAAKGRGRGACGPSWCHGVSALIPC